MTSFRLFFFGVHFLTFDDHVQPGRLSSDHNIDRRWDAAVKRPFSAFGSKGMKYCRSCFFGITQISPKFHETIAMLNLAKLKIMLNDVGKLRANTNFFKIYFGV